MNLFNKILIIGAIFIIGLIVFNAVDTDRQKEIAQWAKNNQYSIISKDQPIFDTGPYFMVQEHQTVYRVKVRTKNNENKTFYFRFGFGDPDIEEYK